MNNKYKMNPNINAKLNNITKDYKEIIEEEEKIDQIMDNITLKFPRNPFTQFVMSQGKLSKKKYKSAQEFISAFYSTCVEKWKVMTSTEKKEYYELFLKEKQKFKLDLERVRHYLFLDYNDKVSSYPTSYRIFLNEKLRDGLEKNLDPKSVINKAKSIWIDMKYEEKKIYINKKIENNNWFSKAQNLKKINPLTLFIQKKVQESKDNNSKLPSIKAIEFEWKKLSKKQKETFDLYAQQIIINNEKMQDLYDILSGKRPKKPVGAYNMFLQEKAKNNEIKSIKEGSELWKNLTEDQKEEFLRKSHRRSLAYKYKKMLYEKKIKKMLPKRPKNALQIFLKEKRGIKPENGEKWLAYWEKIFKGLPLNKRKKYDEKAKKERINYEKAMKPFKNKIFDFPKRPKSEFKFFLENAISLKSPSPEITKNMFILQTKEEWEKLSIEDKNNFAQKAKDDKLRYKQQIKEFEKFGFYTISNDKKDKEENSKKLTKKKLF